MKTNCFTDKLGETMSIGLNMRGGALGKGGASDGIAGKSTSLINGLNSCPCGSGSGSSGSAKVCSAVWQQRVNGLTIYSCGSGSREGVCSSVVSLSPFVSSPCLRALPSSQQSARARRLQPLVPAPHPSTLSANHARPCRRCRRLGGPSNTMTLPSASNPNPVAYP